LDVKKSMETVNVFPVEITIIWMEPFVAHMVVNTLKITKLV